MSAETDIEWRSDEDHGNAAPELSLVSDAQRAVYAQTHQYAQVLGAYWRDPIQLDLELYLKAGPDPLPLSSLDLARICTSINQGGAVLVMATHQEAIDAVRLLVEQHVGVGHA